MDSYPFVIAMALLVLLDVLPLAGSRRHRAIAVRSVKDFFHAGFPLGELGGDQNR